MSLFHALKQKWKFEITDPICRLGVLIYDINSVFFRCPQASEVEFLASESLALSF